MSTREIIVFVKGLNILGVLLSMIGVWIVYKNSPINFDMIDGGGANLDFEKKSIKSARMNKNIRKGVIVILVGSFLQICSTILS